MFQAYLLVFFLVLALASPAGAFAASQGDNPSGWRAVLADHAHSPSFLLAVDKELQLFSVFERRSDFAKVAEFSCTTGQNEGDKMIRGDMKTPEGIYFVVSHIKSGLDYALYGNEAYPLNYPNPVDRLRGKTGSGIWIHGKGVPLIPLDSNGCVGMQNQDLATFDARYLLGRPIALAQGLESAPAVPDKSVLAQELAADVEAWAKAWSARSDRMFDFYNPAAYALAQGQEFSRFRAQKEALFKALPWIRTTVSGIQVLEGPGYWVTWFNQEYAAPGIQSLGTRRLYWQPDARGRLRIVGMEWVKDLKSPLEYSQAGYRPVSPAVALEVSPAPPVAGEKPVPSVVPDSREALFREGLAFVGHWQEAWLRRNLRAYRDCYDPEAVQDQRRGIEAIAAYKRQLWENRRIVKLDLRDVRLESVEGGLRARMLQEYQDDGGYEDRGEKTLYLLKSGQSWRITREEWAPPG